MSFFNVFNIAGSAMTAQNVRLNTIASNMANAASVAGSPEQAYKARQPVFSTLYNDMVNPDNQAAAGVQVLGIVESQAEHPSRYEPGHPLADDNGYVHQANVDMIEEMTNMMVTSRNYENNVEMLSTAKELLLRTLRLGE